MPASPRLSHAAPLFGLLIAFAGPAAAAPLCPAGANAAPHKAPASLAPAIRRAFGLSGDIGAAYYRCSGGRTLACVTGANIPCFKANKARALPGATQYCRENPGADFIPMAATGHDTIYEWKCMGEQARPGRQVAPLDGEGYFAENWKAVE